MVFPISERTFSASFDALIIEQFYKRSITSRRMSISCVVSTVVLVTDGRLWRVGC